MMLIELIFYSYMVPLVFVQSIFLLVPTYWTCQGTERAVFVSLCLENIFAQSPQGHICVCVCGEGWHSLQPEEWETHLLSLNALIVCQ